MIEQSSVLNSVGVECASLRACARDKSNISPSICIAPLDFNQPSALIQSLKLGQFRNVEIEKERMCF